MKIAFVYDAIYPFVKGGAEKRLYEIGKRLSKKGHEVHWFGIKWWGGENVIEKDGIILHGVCKPMSLYTQTGRRSIKEALWFSLKLIKPLLKEKFDIIDCQEFPYFPCFVCRVCSSVKRTPLVITWHEVWDDYWYEYLGGRGIAGKVVERMTTHLADKVIAVSERTKRDLNGIGLRKKVRVIPNGIDFREIEGIGASEEESDVIFVGRLIKEKNVDVLIKAINLMRMEIPDVECVIIGDGPKRGELEKLASDLKVENNIRFMGFLEDYDDVISYMKSSKVFVLPSTREGFGIVALEANASGLPVVTVDHKRNAACDFINNGNGFICELSEGDVAEKIFEGLGEREKMSEVCVESAKRYDWDGIVNSTESCYNKVIDTIYA